MGEILKNNQHFGKFHSRQDCKTTCFLATHIKGVILHMEKKKKNLFIFWYFICKELGLTLVSPVFVGEKQTNTQINSIMS